MEDLRRSSVAMSENSKLNFPPNPHQIDERIKAVKESAPGKDGFRSCFIKKAVIVKDEELYVLSNICLTR